MPGQQQRVKIADAEKPGSKRSGHTSNGRITTGPRKRNGANSKNGSATTATPEKASRLVDTNQPEASSGSSGIDPCPQTAPNNEPVVMRIPTSDEIKHELWRIASGDGSEASRVSALRALADIMGLLRSAPPELPEAMSAYMDALARGLARPTES